MNKKLLIIPVITFLMMPWTLKTNQTNPNELVHVCAASENTVQDTSSVPEPEKNQNLRQMQTTGVILLVWAGIAVMLIRIERKLKSMEKQINDR